MKFPNVRIENKHLISESDKGLALLDTGSPFTLGEDHPLMDGVRENTGLPIQTLVGMDILGDGALFLDIENNKVEVQEIECNYECILEEALHTGEGSANNDKDGQVELMCNRSVGSVPCVKTNLGWFAIDTGAMQSFVRDTGYTDSDIVGTQNEFLPSGEKFVANLVECNVSINDKDYTIRPAILPKKYEGILDGWKVDGVIGLDILSKDKFVITKEIVSPVVAFEECECCGRIAK